MLWPEVHRVRCFEPALAQPATIQVSPMDADENWSRIGAGRLRPPARFKAKEAGEGVTLGQSLPIKA